MLAFFNNTTLAQIILLFFSPFVRCILHFNSITMLFTQVTYTEHKKTCRFVLTSTAGVAWGDVSLHRAVVSLYRIDEEWARAAIELHGSLEGWVVPQVHTYSEKDHSWWPFLLHIFAVDDCPWADVLAQRLCDVFHYQRLVEEEAAWAAEIELQRAGAPRTIFRPVAIVRTMPRAPTRRTVRQLLAERRRAGSSENAL